MEKAFQGEYRAGTITDHKTTYERAVKLMHSKESKAFDLSQEAATSRAKYGSGKFSDGVLMARRLVEVGVPFVEVNLGGWDTHQDNFDRVKSLSGQIDSPIAALIEDLKERGLLDSTLVVWMGEFGRTPKINTNISRDHWPDCYTVLFAGGGVKRGFAHGASDRHGAYPAEHMVRPDDVAATFYRALGIDSRKEYNTRTGRPVMIVRNGAPLKELVS